MKQVSRMGEIYYLLMIPNWSNGMLMELQY
jgi:hypothetical protein